MHGRDMRDGRIAGQILLQQCQVRQFVLASTHGEMRNLQALQHANHAFGVSAVDDHAGFSVRRNASGKYRFDAEGAAALQQHSFPVIGRRQIRDGQELFTNSARALVELHVPRTGVMQHRALDRFAGGQRTGSKKDFVACQGSLKFHLSLAGETEPERYNPRQSSAATTVTTPSE